MIRYAGLRGLMLGVLLMAGAAPAAHAEEEAAPEEGLRSLGRLVRLFNQRLADPRAEEGGDAGAGLSAVMDWLLQSELRDRIHVSGTLSSEAAIETETGKGQKWELILKPEFEIELPYGWDLTAIPRLRYDYFDRLEPDQPYQDSISHLSRRIFIGDHTDLELRELYIQNVIRDVYVTLGKQQVVWGKADGLRVLDVVNPFDFREFILDDFEDARIPTWMANVEIPVGEATLQLLWIPDLTYHQLPEDGARYEFVSNVPPRIPGIRTIIEDVDRPGNWITDSDVGARLSWFWKGWDLTLNYLYHYDDIPVLYRQLQLLPTGPQIVVSPTYERTHLVGGTFSNAFGDLTVRGEFGYSFDKYYSSVDPMNLDGVHKSDEFAYVVGLDWYGFSKTLLSVQFFQNYLMDDAPGLLREEVENNVSFLAKRDFLNDTLELSTLTVHNLNNDDGFSRFKAKYALRDDLHVWTGVDVLYGEKDGLFGQFEENSRVLFGFEWSF